MTYPIVDGRYQWACPHCRKMFRKTTPQGLGMAKENHLRSHRVKTVVNIQ